MTDKSALQNYIDDNLKDPDGACYSFVCRGQVGDCIIPEGVCIRFINCKLSGITSNGRNILNFDGCEFNEGKYIFTNSVVNINKCITIADDIIIQENSKLYISHSECQAGIYLKNNSYCKSNSTLYNSEKNIAFSVEDDCKIDSYLDSFSNYNGPVFNLKNNSFIKVSSPRWLGSVGLNNKIVCNLDTYSKLEITGLEEFTGQPEASFASLVNNSGIKLNNINNFLVYDVSFNLKDSYCSITDIKNLSVKTTLINAVNSSIELNEIPVLKNTTAAYLFDCKNSYLALNNVKTLTSTGGCFKLQDTSLTCTNGSSIYDQTYITASADAVITSTTNAASLNKAKFVFNNIYKINSSAKLFNINDASLSLYNINNLISLNDLILSTVGNIKVTIDNVKSLQSSSSSIVTANNSKNNKIFLNGIDNISSNQRAFTLKNSSISLNNIKSIIARAGDAIKLVSCEATLLNINTLQSNSGNAIIATEASKIKLNNVKTVKGNSNSINVNCPNGNLSIIGSALSGNVSLTNIVGVLTNITTTNNITITDCPDIIFNNVTSTSELTNINSNLTNNKCMLGGLTGSNSSVTTNKKSVFSKSITINNSTLLNYSTTASSNISLSSAALLNLKSSFSSTSLSGKSAAILGSSSGDVSNNADGTFSSPVGGLLVADGNIAISANNVIDIRSNQIDSKIRDTFVMDVKTKYTLKVGASTVNIDPALIALKAITVTTN